jgi:hypothetical protein
MKRSAKIRRWLTGIGATLCLLTGLLLPASFVSADSVTVSVDAPATAAPGEYFTADIDVSSVTDFDAALFDVVFNSTVLAIDSITDGQIGVTTIPVAQTNQIAAGRVRILVNVPGTPGVTGSGYLCQVSFHATGAAGTSSPINLENGSLSNKYADAISANWTGTTVTIAAPDISVSPTSKNFGSLTVGSSSSPQTFTVSNVGSASLVIGTITVTGTNANQFSKQNDNCTGQTIAAGGSATLQIVFSPTSTGAKSATLSIPSNDPDEGTVTISLSGTGVTAPTTTPTLTVTVTETMPPVTITQTQPAGTVTEKVTITQTQPAGTVTETAPPQTITKTQPPGTITETLPPTTTTTTLPPGTITTTLPPGTITQPATTVTTTVIESGKPQINWPLTGGLIAAVVVVGLGVFLWMRRRAT